MQSYSKIESDEADPLGIEVETTQPRARKRHFMRQQMTNTKARTMAVDEGSSVTEALGGLASAVEWQSAPSQSC